MHGTANPVFGSSILPPASRILATVLLSSLFLLLPLSPALADPPYYLELGEAASEEQAETHWQEISKRHSAQLRGLKRLPGSLVGVGPQIIHRVYAGPLDSKPKAQKICALLFRRDTPCFVLEGLVQPPPPYGEYAERGISLDKPLPKAEASVDVAEAVRVPLSDKVAKPKIYPIPTIADDARPIKGGWLRIASFTSEETAAKLWQRVRTENAALAARISVRIVRSVGEDGEVALGAGPFSDMEQALDFCSKAVFPLDDGLTCRFQQADMNNTRSLPSLAPAASGQEEPRQGFYWARVVIAETETEALESWATLKSEHGDTLAGQEGKITEPTPESPVYSVLAGPFDSRESAGSLCIKLRSSGVHCRIQNQ